MRIDTHQHYWRYEPRDYPWIDAALAPLKQDFLPMDCTRDMARLGFDGAIAVQARQTAAETPWLLELADAHPSIVGVIGWVDLRSPAARDDIANIARHPMLLGLRHIVQSEPDGFL